MDIPWKYWSTILVTFIFIALRPLFGIRQMSQFSIFGTYEALSHIYVGILLGVFFVKGWWNGYQYLIMALAMTAIELIVFSVLSPS